MVNPSRLYTKCLFLGTFFLHQHFRSISAQCDGFGNNRPCWKKSNITVRSFRSRVCQSQHVTNSKVCGEFPHLCMHVWLFDSTRGGG
jgi:hypothetical protein